MNVRMIVTDLDGTLFQPDKTVTPRALRALTAAHDAGIVVMAATDAALEPEAIWERLEPCR